MSGLGFSPRPVASRLAVYDIRDFGATTGMLNNEAAVQNAINTAEGIGGGTVWAPGGLWHSGPFAMGHRVSLQGASMGGAKLKLVNGVNADFVTNKVSPDGVAANAQMVALRSLTLDGNRANQTAGRGVFWTQNPQRGQATGDDVNDPRMLMENVFLRNIWGDGFANTGRSEIHLHNVNVFFIGGHGFVPDADTFFSACKTGATGKAGYYITVSSIRIVNSKAFYAGDGTATPTQGHGFHIVGSGRGVSLSNCEGQDCKAAGLRIENSAHRTIVESFVADSNSKHGKGLYAGVEIAASRHCIISAVCFERNDPVVASSDPNFCPQRYALKLETGATHNRIRITHSATSGGAVVDEPIMPSANTAALLSQNDVQINAMGAYRAATYAATFTPDPYSGSEIAITLTGNITIAATTQMHAGMEMSFIFTQDATGARTVTFASQYKVSWTPNTTAGRINIISFRFNGSAWVQTSSVVGLA